MRHIDSPVCVAASKSAAAIWAQFCVRNLDLNNPLLQVLAMSNAATRIGFAIT
jgi:hypothetical protein